MRVIAYYNVPDGLKRNVDYPFYFIFDVMIWLNVSEALIWLM